MNLDLQSTQPVWFGGSNPRWSMGEGTSPLRLRTVLHKCQHALASALVDMAETNLLHGEPLPQPDPTCTDPDADLEEPIYSSDQWVQG